MDAAGTPTLPAVAPRTADPFKPPPEASYSKRKVDQAGDLARRYLHMPDEEYEAAPFGGIDPTELVDAFTKVTWWRGLHARPLGKTAAALRYHVGKEDALIDGRIDVTQRLKRRTTIIGKLGREPTMKLTRMADIGGARARLPSTRHVYAVSRRLKKSWTIVKTRDYIEDPKPSGYRALHHIVRRDGQLIEVQLRTELQDAWANQVEEDGRNLGQGFKFGAGDTDVHGYYQAIGVAFAEMDAERPLPADLIRELNLRYRRIKDRLGR